MASKKKTAHTRKRSRPVQPKKPKINKNILIVVILAAIIVIAIGLFLVFGNQGNDDQTHTDNPIAIINTTKGNIEVELYKDQAPKTVENFIKLVNDHFYDGMIFHRISDNFMIQAGNTYPNGTTKTSPYGNIEVFEGGVSHVDGAISMASTGAGVPGSAQFFICDGNQTFLDGSYAAFGVVISGIDVVRDIADEEHDASLEPSPGGGKPIHDIIINSITMKE
jgi:cyclophilin family peptidyl-prolyl cis-trans isomerase